MNSEPYSRPAAIELTQLGKTYGSGATAEVALHGVDLTIATGALTAIIGKSGSGKSTLLNLVAALDTPTTGEVKVAGTPVSRLDENARATWRASGVGIVFQFFQLLPTLTIAENVMLPMDFVGRLSGPERSRRALGLLEQVELREHAHKFPAMLSGGQQQRAAIARALANDPPLVVADEPTGNLDSRTADAVLGILTSLVDAGKTVVLVTHEREIARVCDRVIRLEDGAVGADERGDRTLRRTAV